MVPAGRPIVLVLLAVAACLSSAAARDDLDSWAREIEGKLMAPCCMANTVAEHHSALAIEMRGEIRAMLRRGFSEDEIIDHYVAQYGIQVRAVPRASGFNLVAWLLPLAFLLFGSALLYVVVRRWASASREERPRAWPSQQPPEYAERLRRELAEFD